MESARYLPPRSRNGAALVLSLIFIVMFSAMAVAMATMSGTTEPGQRFAPEIVMHYNPSNYSEVVL
jgi:hypothetical protein